MALATWALIALDLAAACELLTRAPSAAIVWMRPLAGDGIGSYLDSRSIFSIAVNRIAREQGEAK